MAEEANNEPAPAPEMWIGGTKYYKDPKGDVWAKDVKGNQWKVDVRYGKNEGGVRYATHFDGKEVEWEEWGKNNWRPTTVGGKADKGGKAFHYGKKGVADTFGGSWSDKQNRIAANDNGAPQDFFKKAA